MRFHNYFLCLILLSEPKFFFKTKNSNWKLCKRHYFENRLNQTDQNRWFFGEKIKLKGPWHEIFDLNFLCSFFSSGALIRGGNSILQINSNSCRKSKSKKRPCSINTEWEDFRAVLILWRRTFSQYQYSAEVFLKNQKSFAQY